MEESILNAFGKMTYGIYILTTFHEKMVNGMVASWVSQVSYGPPMVMVAIHPNRYSHTLIERSGYFALHIFGPKPGPFIEIFQGHGSGCQVRFRLLESRKNGLSHSICLPCLPGMPGKSSLQPGKSHPVCWRSEGGGALIRWGSAEHAGLCRRVSWKNLIGPSASD